jgi:biopolymer transport protein ExbD
MFENYNLVERDAQKPEINLAPFVDTIMILLIFFVVTANLYVVTGVDVSKPKAQTARTVGQKAVMIGITREGTIHIYGRQVSLERLQNLIEQETAKMPDLSVLIIADKEASIGKAVQVMDKCALGGAAKVSIAAEKE